MEINFTALTAGGWGISGQTDLIELRQQMLASSHRVSMELAWQLGDKDLKKLQQAMKEKSTTSGRP